MKGTPPFTRPVVELEYLTPYSAALGPLLEEAWREPLGNHQSSRIIKAAGSIWISMEWTPRSMVHLRICNEIGSSRVRVRSRGSSTRVEVASSSATYVAELESPEPTFTGLLRCRVELRTHAAVRMEDCGRDVMLTDRNFRLLREGYHFTSQTGSAAGHAFAGVDDGTCFYLQNMGALGRYVELTGAALKGVVGVDWPRLGIELPPGDKPIAAGKRLGIADGFLALCSGGVTTEAARSMVFVESMAEIHRLIEPKLTEWPDWRQIAARTVRDVAGSVQCLRKVKKDSYLNAYVGSAEKPPESMVQAAVLVPLVEYGKWIRKPQPLAETLVSNIPKFYIPQQGTMARWLPGETFGKGEPSEEEQPGKMDSWYLLHTLLNVGRLAELGCIPREVFLRCMPYVIRIAHHFDHDWPVFYEQETLEVCKRETEDGAGGEQDVAGLYTHVMMQARRITGDDSYLREAETAAGKLRGLGFGVLYQSNNAAFSAVALAWLWRATGNAEYKDLSIVCMGSILSHLWLWEPMRREGDPLTYMGLPPLHDAPYIAAYEEGEVLTAFEAWRTALADEVPAPLDALLVEYGKHLLHRAHHYYPSQISADRICESPREGVISRSLMIPLEDLYAFGEPPGQVGQEVYGAALGLILCVRSIHRWNGVPFVMWSDAPLSLAEFSLDRKSGGGQLDLTLAGSPAFRYHLRLTKPRRKRFIVHRAGSRGRRTRVRMRKQDGGWQLEVPGGSEVRITWAGADESSRPP